MEKEGNKVVYLSLILIVIAFLVVFLVNVNTKELNFDSNNDGRFNNNDLGYWSLAYEQKLISSEFVAQLLAQIPEDGKVKCRFGNDCFHFILSESDVAPIVGFVVANGINGELEITDNVLNNPNLRDNKVTGFGIGIIGSPIQTGYLPDGSKATYIDDTLKKVERTDGRTEYYDSEGKIDTLTKPNSYEPEQIYLKDEKGQPYLNMKYNEDGSHESYRSDGSLEARGTADDYMEHYDENGKVDMRSFPGPDGADVTYDENGNPTDALYRDGTQVKYNPDGSADITRPDGTTYKTYPQGLKAKDSGAYIPNKEGNGGTQFDWNYDKSTGEMTRTKTNIDSNGVLNGMEVYMGNPDGVGGDYYHLSNPVANPDGTTTYDYETGGYVDANGNRGGGQYKSDYTGQITLPAGSTQQGNSYVNVDGNKINVN